MIAPALAPYVTGFLSLFFTLGTVELAVAVLRLAGRAGAGEDV